MDSKLSKAIEEAAKEVWEENRVIHGQYDNDFQAYLDFHQTNWEAMTIWTHNPQVRQEFGGDLNSFLVYKRHEAGGSIGLSISRITS